MRSSWSESRRASLADPARTRGLALSWQARPFGSYRFSRSAISGFPTDPRRTPRQCPPRGSCGVRGASASTAEYAPRIGLADIQDGFNLSVLNVGLLSAEWRTEMTRLTLSEYASYGFLNYSAQQPPGPTTTGGIRLDPLLRQKLLYEASSTSLSAVITPEKRWSVSVAVSYSLSGGADDEARSVLPFVKGPLIAATFDYGLGKSDRLITGASGEHSNLSTGFDYYFLRVSEGWAHEFASRSSITLGAGLTAVRSSSFTPTVPLFIAPTLIDGTHYDLYPTVDAALVYQLPFRDKTTLRARSALAPVINRATGLLSQQVLALVNASWFENPVDCARRRRLIAVARRGGRRVHVCLGASRRGILDHEEPRYFSGGEGRVAKGRAVFFAHRRTASFRRSDRSFALITFLGLRALP